MNGFVFYMAIFGFSVLINFIFLKFWKLKFLKSKVNKNRWDSKVVPLTGGITLFLVFYGASLLRLNELFSEPKLGLALIGGCFMFFLGILDDLFNLKSYQKLLLQIFLVLVVLSLGIRASFLGKPFSYIVTFLWILGITNAFNLLDNIDGLSAGIGAIAFFFLTVNYVLEGALLLGHFSVIMGLILLGFLLFNFNPAKLYLGDSGALLIGYFLSIFTIIGSQKSGESVFITMIFPILIMLIPILDTILVSITRNMRGQSAFEGGRDHLSHRLVMLGMSEKQAVLLLYSISILLGVSALFFESVPPVFSMVIYFFISLVFVLFGVYIGKIKIGAAGNERKNVAILSTDFLYKKRVLHILVDLILIFLIYYLSYLIRFEGILGQKTMNLFLESVPVVMVLKMVFLFYFQVYKIDSRYSSIADGLKIIKGVTLGSVSTVLVLTFLTRFMGYSRAVFVIDWMLTIIVLGVVKVFYRIFDELFSNIRSREKKKIIIVSGDRAYQSIRKYLQFRPEMNIAVEKYLSLTDFDFDVMIGSITKADQQIHLILMEDKTILSDDQAHLIREMGIDIVSEKEFFKGILV